MEMEELIKSITNRYQPACRYLKSAKVINGRKVKGRFIVRDAVHLVGKSLEHLAAVEIQICLNQLLMVFIHNLVESGYIKEWGPTKWEDYWGKLSSEHMFIVEQTTHFNEILKPNKIFTGVLTLHDEFKSKRGNYHLTLHFDFGEGAHTGTVRIAFVP